VSEAGGASRVLSSAYYGGVKVLGFDWVCYLQKCDWPELPPSRSWPLWLFALISPCCCLCDHATTACPLCPACRSAPRSVRSL
jgi:hypothetical protein